MRRDFQLLSYDEKERNEKSENEARLATAKDTPKI